MRVYPTMTFHNYIRKFASVTYKGMFHCDICHSWIKKQRWMHFKAFHR